MRPCLLLLIFIFIHLFASAADNGKNLLEVSPNPGNGHFTVSFKSDLRGNLQLSVCDATGKYVYLKSRRDFNVELKELLDLTALPKGIYIVQTEIEQIISSTKLILQ